MLEQVFRPQATPYRDDQFQVTGSADATKLFKLEVDTQAAGKTLTLDVGAQTTSRTATIPVLTASDTFAFDGVANVFTKAQVIDLGTGSRSSPSTGTVLHLSQVDGTGPRLQGDGYGITGITIFGRSFGGTRGAETATPDNRNLIAISGIGYDGVSIGNTQSGLITIVTDGLYSGTNLGSEIRIFGTPNGSTTLAQWASFKRGGLALTQGTITTAINAFSSTATWNAVGVTFEAWSLDVTNTASAAASLLANLKVGGATKFSVRVDGLLTLSNATLLATNVALTNNAAAAGGTLLNAPVAGNPTKWIPIDDNGTIRNIPAW